MAAKKKKKTKYARSSKRDVESEMRRYKKGTAKSGRGGKGGKVKSRKQAIAIGLSKARKKGKRVPKKKSCAANIGDIVRTTNSAWPKIAKAAAIQKAGNHPEGLAWLPVR
jgi:hypothetical protein